jgi:hypothetical protein
MPCKLNLLYIEAAARISTEGSPGKSCQIVPDRGKNIFNTICRCTVTYSNVSRLTGGGRRDQAET